MVKKINSDFDGIFIGIGLLLLVVFLVLLISQISLLSDNAVKEKEYIKIMNDVKTIDTTFNKKNIRK